MFTNYSDVFRLRYKVLVIFYFSVPFFRFTNSTDSKKVNQVSLIGELLSICEISSFSVYLALINWPRNFSGQLSKMMHSSAKTHNALWQAEAETFRHPLLGNQTVLTKLDEPNLADVVHLAPETNG